MSNMKTIEATYRIVTPMFIGGADQKPGDGIRPPSFKGALRFWWRALNWGNYPNLADLHEKEAELFGAAVKDKQGGQGKFLLKVESKVAPSKLQVANFSPRSYMLGQGLWGNGRLMRDAIDGSFEVNLRFKKDASDEDIESVADALHVMGLVGGLGSRSRRAWGSITIERLDVDGVNVSLPIDRNAYEEQVNALLKGTQHQPPFSAFCGASKAVYWEKDDTDPLQVVDGIGKEMGLYRSWGRNGQVFKQKAEQNFKADHDSILGVTQGNLIHRHPERLVFGLPHNYFFSSTKKKVDIQNASLGHGAEAKKFKRRASPLLIHVHRLPNGKHVGLLLLLASDFLPEGTKIEIGGNRVDEDVDWGVIEKFMNRPAFNKGGVA